VKQAQAGQQEALIQLLREIESPLYRTAFYMLGNEQDALDMTQEALIKIYRHIKQFKQQAQFKTWAQRIITNLCIDLCRQRKQGLPNHNIDVINQLPYHHVEEEIDRRLLKGEIELAISRLSEEQRAAIVMRYMHDFTYQEIAEAMDLPLNTVKSHLFRARKVLKELLSAREENGKGGDAG
jgi:RNA polymerase sigma-70 factor (ECF subfamily)